jgi:hypothetical protein
LKPGVRLFVLDQATLEVMGDAGAEYAGRAGEDVEVIDRHCGMLHAGWRKLGATSAKGGGHPMERGGEESCRDASLRSG